MPSPISTESSGLTLLNYHGHEIRQVELNGKPAIVVADVATILGYRDANTAGRILRDHQKGYAEVRTPGGAQRMLVATLEGFNRLTIKSNAKNADDVQDWLTDDVMPAIQTTGSYNAAPALTDEEIVNRALQITSAKVKELEAKVEADAPKVDYVDQFVAVASDVIAFSVAAHQLGITETGLRSRLIDAHWIYRVYLGEHWSKSKQRKVKEYEYRPAAAHAAKFSLRPQFSVPRRHNGQVRQTLYIVAAYLPNIQRRIEKEPTVRPADSEARLAVQEVADAEEAAQPARIRAIIGGDAPDDVLAHVFYCGEFVKSWAYVTVDDLTALIAQYRAEGDESLATSVVQLRALLVAHGSVEGILSAVSA